jgi:hypothetical protein
MAAPCILSSFCVVCWSTRITLQFLCFFFQNLSKCDPKLSPACRGVLRRGGEFGPEWLRGGGFSGDRCALTGIWHVRKRDPSEEGREEVFFL